MLDLFDFDSFLRDLHVQQALGDVLGRYCTDSDSEDPSTNGWDVVKLTGGLINVTVRVIAGTGTSKRSVILKYAPPFVAALGEKTPFGQFRQVCSAFSSQRVDRYIFFHVPLEHRIACFDALG